MIALDLVISSNNCKSIPSWVGGTCGNVLIILRYLGWKSFPISRLNGDSASKRICSDLIRWKVNLDFAEQMPSVPPPVIVHTIRRTKDANATHTFSLKCPNCNSWLPSYRAITNSIALAISDQLPKSEVFFFDRASKGTLTLAKKFAESGALVVFEPSSDNETKYFQQALSIAHIIKYSCERIPSLTWGTGNQRPGLIEIQTLGSRGLRYRAKLPKVNTLGWKTISSIPAKLAVDTAGCGDWLTAGLLSKVGTGGLDQFLTINELELFNALRFGQALAAWNSGFEGARGGMYHVDKRKFASDIENIQQGKPCRKPRLQSIPSSLIRMNGNCMFCR